jgi:hypothetical protein
MPRILGAKNYKNNLLIPIVAEILPNGEYGWSAVALAYQEQAREDEPRNTDDLKRHWVKNLCQNMKKPTGRPGENSDRTHRCIAIERKIMEKTHAGMMGIEESEDEDRDSGAVVENEGELGVVNTLRRSPPRVSKTRANGFIRSQLVSSRVPTAKVVDEDDDGRVIAEWESRREEEEFQDYSDRIDNPPSPIVAAYTRVVNARDDADSLFASPTSASQSQSIRNALEKAAESTPPMSKSVRTAMARAESLAKAAKTKNSSNKKKERTSIAGTIVKMIERIDSSSNSTMTANMNMMMMRQMEEMNRGMARRHKEERRERKREKKRRQKRRDKRNAKRRAMIDLDDHGGKKGEGSLSESSSSESSSSSSDDSSQDSGYGKGEWRGQTNVGGDKEE